MSSVEPDHDVSEELGRKAEALGLIHYYKLRTRRAALIWWPVTIAAAAIGTIFWSWIAIPIVFAVGVALSSALSHRTSKLIEKRTGLTAQEQRELLHNLDPFFGASSDDTAT